MRCSNDNCYWNFKNQCVCEDLKCFKNTHAQDKTCLWYLRKDFDLHLYELNEKSSLLLNECNHEDLHKVLNFLEKDLKKVLTSDTKYSTI